MEADKRRAEGAKARMKPDTGVNLHPKASGENKEDSCQVPQTQPDNHKDSNSSKGEGRSHSDSGMENMVRKENRKAMHMESQPIMLVRRSKNKV